MMNIYNKYYFNCQQMIKANEITKITVNHYICTSFVYCLETPSSATPRILSEDLRALSHRVVTRIFVPTTTTRSSIQ